MKPLLREHDGRGVVRLTPSRPNAFNSLSEAMLAALLADFAPCTQVKGREAPRPLRRVGTRARVPNCEERANRVARAS